MTAYEVCPSCDLPGVYAIHDWVLHPGGTCWWDLTHDVDDHGRVTRLW